MAPPKSTSTPKPPMRFSPTTARAIAKRKPRTAGGGYRNGFGGMGFDYLIVDFAGFHSHGWMGEAVSFIPKACISFNRVS